DGVDELLVDGEDTGNGGVQVDPAGGSRLRLDAGEAQRSGNAGCGVVLLDVVFGKGRHDEFGNAGGAKDRDVICGDTLRLAETAPVHHRRMCQDCPCGFVQRNRPEFHAASPFASAPLACWPRDRRARTIWAKTATAISAGLEAP